MLWYPELVFLAMVRSCCDSGQAIETGAKPRRSQWVQNGIFFCWDIKKVLIQQYGKIILHKISWLIHNVYTNLYWEFSYNYWSNFVNSTAVNMAVYTFFWERERVGEKYRYGREISINWLPLIHPQLGTWPAT